MTLQKLFLNGRWTETSDRTTVRDPGNGEAIAEVAAGGPVEAGAAVTAACEAFAGWRQLTGLQRGDHLLNVAVALGRKKDEIARIITRENGKPLAQSAGEVGMTIDHFRWFAEEARRAYGRIVPHQAEGKRHLILRQPVGVAAAIAPWNFPLVLAARKIAPALAAGCTAILRPASQTPLSAGILARCFEEVGIPPGVFQLITGPAEPIADVLLGDPRCAKISFTGSTEVGKKLAAGAAGTLTKLSLELGGHAPVLVFADADMKAAVDAAVITKFRNTGQSCIAANRIYVERSVYEEFMELFVSEVQRLKVGYGLDDGVDIGPVVNEAALETALAQVRNATNAGARLVCGGSRVTDLENGSKGFYLAPTVLADVPANAECMLEETFAPVAPVTAFDTEEEAVKAANDTRYGLAAYAFTSDLNRALRLAERLEAGTVGINDAVPSTSNCPFGGMKESGQGRELGMEGMDSFLETKHVSIGGLTGM